LDHNLETNRHFAALMTSAQNGDRAAYARLLREITPRLRAFARARYRSLRPQDVEDLVQDVLLALHAVRATYDPGRPFLPWLHGIAQHRMADGARRAARRAAHEVAVDEVPETFCVETANVLEDSYRDPEALRHAVRSLPPGQREAVEMLKLRELSLKEASAMSGMSIGALKVAVHRAIKTLRRTLAAGA
jgi:RNA polymerase sigma factor (sigma-70 family)